MNVLDEKGKVLLESLLSSAARVKKIVQTIADSGGRALLVGGAVRDILLNIQTKDLDIEVHGLSLDQLQSILSSFGPVSFVGKAFGVFRLHGLDIDWSLPRSDKAGRKPDVTIDPHMSIEDAFRRRDLTVNAMGIDLVTYELIDPFNGLDDLQKKVLRSPDIQFFTEDPLRFYRVMQFISRFEMTPDKELTDVCTTMDIRGVSVERIEDEFEKMLLKSKRPSLGLRWLHAIGRVKEIAPELAATVSIQQNPAWHPEGDVFEHTMQTVDAAAIIAASYADTNKKLILLYAALCHDLGKVETTEKTEEKIISYGHAQAGAAPTKRMLKRITKKKELIETVAKLVRYHMAPAQLAESDAKPSAYKRLARKLGPHISLIMLADLALADKQGRNPGGHEPLQKKDPAIEQFLRNAQQAQVSHKAEEPVLLGRDLLDVIQGGPEMGCLLKEAYEIQIEEGIKDKDELKRRVVAKKSG